MTGEGSGGGHVLVPLLGAAAGGGVGGDGGAGDARMSAFGIEGGGADGSVVGGEEAEACWWDESGFRKKRPGGLSLETIKVYLSKP